MSRVARSLSLALILVMFLTSLFTARASFDEATKTAVFVSHFNVNITYANASKNYLFAEVDVNLSRIPNQTIPVEGVTDFYKVELLSNGRVIGSNMRGCTVGQGLSKEQMTSLSMNYGHVGFSSINYNQEIVKWDVWYDPTNPTFAEPLTIRLSRIGWVIVNGNEWLSNLNYNEVIQEVKLSKAENSFTYGNPTRDIVPTSFAPTPSVPELYWFVIVSLMISLFAVAVIFRHRKTAKLNQ